MSVFFGVFGAIETLFQKQWAVPAWVWWVLLVVSFSLAQFLAFWSVYKENSGTPALSPNYSFRKLIKRVVGSKKETLLDNDGIFFSEKQQLAIYKLQTEIRAYAIQGRIQVWGRKNAEVTKEDQPQTLIPVEFWDGGDFGMLETTLGDQKGKVEKILPDNTKLRYWDLAFSKHQIIRLWSRPQVKLNFTSPLKISWIFWHEN